MKVSDKTLVNSLIEYGLSLATDIQHAPNDSRKLYKKYCMMKYQLLQENAKL